MADTYHCPDCGVLCWTGTPHMCGPNSLAAVHQQSYEMTREIAMVVAHKHGRRKAHNGVPREQIIALAKILPTTDEHDAFIAGFDGEKRRMAKSKHGEIE